MATMGRKILSLFVNYEDDTKKDDKPKTEPVITPEKVATIPISIFLCLIGVWKNA